MVYLVKGAPFRYKGVVNVEDCKTSTEVMEKAGLDWRVAKCHVVAQMPAHIGDGRDRGFMYGGNFFNEVPNAYANYRTDYNIPLGIVKERYTPVQNIEAFKFFDDAIGKNQAIWQTAGSFGNGERIFVSAKLPKNILVHGDPTESYLVFTNSHDGSSGVKVLFTTIRVVCQNTLNAAIRQSNNFVSFRHTNSVHKNLDQASQILGICRDMTNDFSECLNEMYKITMKDEEAQEIFAKTILNANELEQINLTGHTIGQIVQRDWRAIQDAEISMKKVNVLSEMNNYYFSGVGQREIVGTGYGVYNAVSGYYSNVDNIEGIKRMDSLLYGDKGNKIKIAGDLILNYK